MKKAWQVLSRFFGWSCMLAMGLMMTVSPSEAQSADPMRFVRWMASDVDALTRNTLSSDAALIAGVTVGSVLLASQFDRSVTRYTQEISGPVPRRVRKIFHEAGNVNVVRPVAVLVFLGSLTSGNEYFQDAAFTSMEAVIFSNLITNAFKLVLGRARPSEEVGPWSFKPFSGARSLPSGHATTVFAFTTPWALYYPGIASYTLFALGIGTAIARMADRQHWLSDVLAGGMIGAGTGYLLARRHRILTFTPVVAVDVTGINLKIRF